MSINHKECAPYLSTTLLRIKKKPAPTVAKLRDALASYLKSDAATEKKTSIHRKIHKADPSAFNQGNLQVAWIHYSERRPPPWYVGINLSEERHHVIFVMRKGTIIALTFSDPAVRTAAIVEIRRQQQGLFSGFELLTAKQVNDAFVGDRIRTLWLSGAHRRTATKADSKILSGIELETALDPLEDQSYYFSSVRSTLDADALLAKGRSSVVIGANPRNARVWLGPSADWSNFSARIEGLIDAAEVAIQKPLARISPLPVLAHPLEGLPDARSPYDMAVIVPESISDGTEDEKGESWLHEFADAARFEISPDDSSPSFEAEIFWANESYGKIKYNFSIGADLRPRIKTEAPSWSENADHQKEIRSICENTDLLTVYYDTGHTCSGGLFYETTFRDARFPNWHWVRLKDFEISSEKPLNGKKFIIEDIGKDPDVSLFGYVAKHWPRYVDGGAAKGWLVCDDGSMESADFIHFDETDAPPRLTLIHVKGSGSDKPNRGLSVSDYEVVVSQAVKNLRHLDRSHLYEKLAETSKGKIGSAVWYNGIRQKNRADILKILKNTGSNMTKTVCVFQPSARRSEVEAIEQLIAQGSDDPRVRRLQQLDALLLAARAECFGLGADFYVIGEDDKA